MTTKTFDHFPETERTDFLNICAEGATAPEVSDVSFTQEIAGGFDVRTCGQLKALLRGFWYMT